MKELTYTHYEEVSEHVEKTENFGTLALDSIIWLFSGLLWLTGQGFKYLFIGIWLVIKWIATKIDMLFTNLLMKFFAVAGIAAAIYVLYKFGFRIIHILF